MDAWTHLVDLNSLPETNNVNNRALISIKGDISNSNGAWSIGCNELGRRLTICLDCCLQELNDLRADAACAGASEAARIARISANAPDAEVNYGVYTAYGQMSAVAFLVCALRRG
jgi:hypothetical protein